MTVKFFVKGVPIPQGSMRAFVNRKTGVPVVVHNSPRHLMEWREAVRMAAEDAARGQTFSTESPWNCILTFYLPKPKTAKRKWPTAKKDDVDKLARAALDSLTEVLWEDDGAVCILTASKVYGQPTGVEVTAWQF